ncbi:hypothetical protein GC163_08120 [bacterium]|nr:hypothetical protein [bacterium]
MISRQEALERVKLGFWIHLGAFAIVNAGLAALNIVNNPDRLWFVWVVLGWGIGVAVHGGLLYFHEPSRERMIQRTQARMESRGQPT